MEMIATNLNDKCELVLTEAGKDILRKEDLSYVKYDADGRCKMQLWHVMQVFGPYIMMGTKVPFETTIKVKHWTAK